MRKLVALTALLVLLAAACGDDDDDAGSATTAGAGTTAAGGTTSSLGPIEPKVYEGDGDQTIDVELPIPGAPAIAVITNTEAGPFTVDALDANGDATANLVDVIGAYSGTVPVDANPSLAPTAQLDIQAPGPWKIELKPLRDIPQFETGSQDGESDAVLAYTGDQRPGVFIFQGQGTGVLIAYPGLSGGLPVTLTSLEGPSDTPAGFELPGPSILQIQAEGPWQLQVAP